MFDLPVPKHVAQFEGRPPTLVEGCDAEAPIEIEGCVIVLNKKKVWRAFMLTVFVNQNHHFFNRQLMWSDKQVLP